MKNINWICSTKKDIGDLSSSLKKYFGYQLFLIQLGLNTHNKPLHGFNGTSVIEICKTEDNCSWRIVCHLSDKIHVLHVFQKKSTCGVSTPKKEMDVIFKRYHELKYS